MKSFIVSTKNTRELFTQGETSQVAVLPGTKKAIKHWVKYGGVIPTHMGEWQRVHKDLYIYHTTIGRTYFFERKGA